MRVGSARALSSLAWLALMLLMAALQIASTYPLLTHTIDEPAHIAAGMELLDRGTFTYEQQHPPLARIAVALGPWLLGAHAHGEPNIFDEGIAILNGGSGYQATLTAARLGVLPFLFLLICCTWLWARRDFGEVAAAVAALTLATTPPVLAHAGLATTDLPVAACLVLALFAFTSWLAHPSAARSIAFGSAVALAVTAKLTALVFLPPCCLAAGLLRLHALGRPGLPLRRAADAIAAVGMAVGAFAATVWVVYGCPADPILPFRDLQVGIAHALVHDEIGQPVFFLGDVGWHGWWLFFLAALLLKTPLSLLALAGYGGFLAVRGGRREWQVRVPLAAALLVLLIASAGNIDGGLRYILPVYPMLALLAGRAAVELAARPLRIRAALLVGALAVQIVVCARAWPEYLAYFNPLAGPHPEHLLVDSDLDWGQDIDRVGRALRDRGATRVWVALQTNARLEQHGFPRSRALPPHRAVAGWIAISATQYDWGTGPAPFDYFEWLKDYKPIAIVGGSRTRLYHIEPGATSGGAGAHDGG